MKKEKGPKIILRNLGNEPEDFSWTEKDSWVASLLDQNLKSLRKPGAPARFKATLTREGKNFLLNGQIELELTPQCGRCGKDFMKHYFAEFSLLLIPREEQMGVVPEKKKPHQDSEDLEREWGASQDDEVYEDVSSSILTSDDLDLSNYFLEQVLLSLPMTFVCNPDCPGLCPRCGADLAASPCACPSQQEDDRWAALRDFKVKT